MSTKTIEDLLRERSASSCELCSEGKDLAVYAVPPTSDGSVEQSVLLCGTCSQQIDSSDGERIDIHHWRCLNDSMWNENPAVQVLAWRMLKRLSAESWCADLLDSLYIDEQTLAWAQAGMNDVASSDGSNDSADSDDGAVVHRDSNGVVLATGDNVTLIKDLNVKDAGFTAKRGTVVRGIHVDADNAQHIEGRVNGQQIVILTQFVKKN